jgi:hypothetical protein
MRHLTAIRRHPVGMLDKSAVISLCKDHGELRENYMIEIGPSSQGSDIFKDDDLVCHCFEYTQKDIKKDYLNNGYSTIFEKISLEKQAGVCDCAQKNPKGR